MTVRNDDPQADAHHRLGRLQAQKVEKWRAMQRLGGSYVLGAVAAWKLLTYEPQTDGGIPWLLLVWIGLALLAFGLASWDQLSKAVRR